MDQQVDDGGQDTVPETLGSWRIAALCASVLGIGLLYVLVETCGGTWGWLLAAISVGCACGAMSSKERWLPPVLSGASVLSGTWFVVLTLPWERVLDRLNNGPDFLKAGLGSDAVLFYLGPLLEASSRSLGHQPIALVLAPAVAIGCTLGVRWLVGRLGASRWIGSALAMVGLGVVFVIGASQPLNMAQLSVPVHSYSYDALIYRATYQNMKAGAPYYRALVAAAAADSRVIAEKAVRGGRFYGWASAPSQIRPPALFFAWKVLTPNALGVFYLAVGIALLAMLSVYLGLRLYVGEVAVFAVFALLPFMQMSVAWSGVFQPDTWAGMFTLLALGLWLWRRFGRAMVVALAAGICRDVALSALLVFALYAGYRAFRGRGKWRGRAIEGAALLGVFVAVYVTHLVQAAPYFGTASSSVGTIGTLLQESAASGFVSKVLQPVSYQGYLWWIVGVPPIALVPAAAIGWVWALRRNVTALAPVVVLLGGWAVFLLVFGAHSGYWGMLFMPLVYAGSGALVACAAATACGHNPWANSARRIAR